MRPWSCRECSTVLGYMDGAGRRITPEPNVGIRVRAESDVLQLKCPECGVWRTWRGDLVRPVSRFEVRGIVVNSRR